MDDLTANRYGNPMTNISNGLVRPYDPDRDRNDIERVWRECGWIEADNKAHLTSFLTEVDAADATVFEEAGHAEALVLVTPGTFCQGLKDLPLAGVTALNTSRVARKRGIAARILAAAIARAFAEGAVVSALGVFERGYYDRLGYGAGTYVHTAQFDPVRLAVPRLDRAPERIPLSDWETVHQARLAIPARHGTMKLTDPRITKAEMERFQNGFGLGFRDGATITHCLWIDAGTGEEGPYVVAFTAYSSLTQYVELMALLAALNDQIRQVRVVQAPGTQIEDFLRQPYQGQNTTRGGAFEERIDVSAHWQLRIGNLEAAVEALGGCGSAWQVNLRLSDPVARFLTEDAPWTGIGGEYTLTLGEECSVAAGMSTGAPGLECDVAAFSRYWMGAVSAEFLQATGAFRCGVDTARKLDETLALPRPDRGWDF